DLSGGPFAPGGTDEGDGSSEIEIEIQLGGAAIGTHDEVHIVGTAGADMFRADGLAANLNAGEATPDDDLSVSGDGELELLGDEGDDEIVFAGYGGENAEIPKIARGGPGADRLLGDLNSSLLDGGSGRDVVDYSPADFRVTVIWDVDNSQVFGSPGLDDLSDVEVAVLSDDLDIAVYQGAATGETLLGAGADQVIFLDPISGDDEADRIVRGGPGTFDFLSFQSTPAEPATVELAATTIGAPWSATYMGFEYAEGGTGNDRFRISKRGTYPGLIGREGEDVIDLRSASQGISVTLGKPTFGPRKWLTAFEMERVLGSNFDDVMLGPAGPGASDPTRFLGFDGRDVLKGAAGPDLLVGGAGADTVRGDDGADSLWGKRGSDLLDGGSGPDVLRGGDDNDTLIGGAGFDDCDGGPGVNSFTGC
ncbi:MAG: Hemolysin-type calcium-binding region, partial [Actinomycetia bacterium]|nr:Hemolysin-type calcium-binding region [Actinomycetes bacterium]